MKWYIEKLDDEETRRSGEITYVAHVTADLTTERQVVELLKVLKEEHETVFVAHGEIECGRCGKYVSVAIDEDGTLGEIYGDERLCEDCV